MLLSGAGMTGFLPTSLLCGSCDGGEQAAAKIASPNAQYLRFSIVHPYVASARMIKDGHDSLTRSGRWRGLRPPPKLEPHREAFRRMTLSAKFEQLRRYARRDGAGMGVSFLLHAGCTLAHSFLGAARDARAARLPILHTRLARGAKRRPGDRAQAAESRGHHQQDAVDPAPRAGGASHALGRRAQQDDRAGRRTSDAAEGAVETQAAEHGHARAGRSRHVGLCAKRQ